MLNWSACNPDLSHWVHHGMKNVIKRTQDCPTAEILHWARSRQYCILKSSSIWCSSPPSTHSLFKKDLRHHSGKHAQHVPTFRRCVADNFPPKNAKFSKRYVHMIFKLFHFVVFHILHNIPNFWIGIVLRRNMFYCIWSHTPQGPASVTLLSENDTGTGALIEKTGKV